MSAPKKWVHLMEHKFGRHLGWSDTKYHDLPVEITINPIPELVVKNDGKNGKVWDIFGGKRISLKMFPIPPELFPQENFNEDVIGLVMCLKSYRVEATAKLNFAKSRRKSTPRELRRRKKLTRKVVDSRRDVLAQLDVLMPAVDSTIRQKFPPRHVLATLQENLAVLMCLRAGLMDDSLDIDDVSYLYELLWQRIHRVVVEYPSKQLLEYVYVSVGRLLFSRRLGGVNRRLVCAARSAFLINCWKIADIESMQWYFTYIRSDTFEHEMHECPAISPRAIDIICNISSQFHDHSYDSLLYIESRDRFEHEARVLINPRSDRYAQVADYGIVISTSIDSFWHDTAGHFWFSCDEDGKFLESDDDFGTDNKETRQFMDGGFAFYPGNSHEGACVLLNVD